MITRAQLEARVATHPLLLDGGLATELEAHGHDLDDPLWSAHLLLSEPNAIAGVHRAYRDAGADVLCSASYQASRTGLASRGLDSAAADAVLAHSIRLARQVAESCERPRWVAASLGSYGACLHDGSEYHGRWNLDGGGLAHFHGPRVDAVCTEQPDFLLFETVPSMQEVRALIEVLRERDDLSAWVSLQIRSGRQSGSGDDLTQIARALDACHSVIAVGINCCAPRFVEEALTRLRSATDKTLLAYPNSGESFEAGNQQWSGRVEDFGEDLPRWLRAGAGVVGGCCRVGPAQIAAMGQLLRGR